MTELTLAQRVLAIDDALGDDAPIAAVRERVLNALITSGGKT